MVLSFAYWLLITILFVEAAATEASLLLVANHIISFLVTSFHVANCGIMHFRIQRLLIADRSNQYDCKLVQNHFIFSERQNAKRKTISKS